MDWEKSNCPAPDHYLSFFKCWQLFSWSILIQLPCSGSLFLLLQMPTIVFSVHPDSSSRVGNLFKGFLFASWCRCFSPVISGNGVDRTISFRRQKTEGQSVTGSQWLGYNVFGACNIDQCRCITGCHGVHGTIWPGRLCGTKGQTHRNTCNAPQPQNSNTPPPTPWEKESTLYPNSIHAQQHKKLT